MKKFTFFDQNHRLTPLEKCKFCDFFLNRCFYSLERLVLYLERHQTLLFGLLLLKRKNAKADYNFYKSDGLTPLQKWEFCDFLKMRFL